MQAALRLAVIGAPLRTWYSRYTGALAAAPPVLTIGANERKIEMSTTYHHLTIDGWIEGDRQLQGALLTYERTYQADGPRGVPNIDYRFVEKGSAVTVGELKDLVAQFGMPEQNVSGEHADIAWDTSWED